MNPSAKLFRALFDVLMISVLAACSSAPVATPSATTPAPSALPPTPLPTATLPNIQTPTPSNDRIAETIPLSSPSSIAIGDGLIWVISGSSVVPIDPQTNQIAGEPIPAGVQFESDIAFNEGTLWVSIIGSGDLGAPNDRDAVSRIDPESGETVATIKVERGPLSLAVTPGVIWVVNFGMSGDAVTQIDTKTNQIIGEPIHTGRAPISMTTGDGSVWVANHDARTVTRIDPDSGQIVANISVPSEPHRITFGEGSVWVANWHDNSVSRIDPQTNQVVGEPIGIGYPAGNIVAGLGSVWVTSDYRVDGKPTDVVVVRIDARTDQVLETIPVGGHPIDVAVTDDAVWVSVQNPDMLLRINP